MPSAQGQSRTRKWAFSGALFAALSAATLTTLTLAMAIPPHSAATPSRCGRLPLVLVEPEPPTVRPEIRCRRPNSPACTIKKGFAKFARGVVEGQRVVKLRRVNQPETLEARYQHVLELSPLMQEIGYLRVQARQLSGQVPTCEPILLYLKDEPIFQTGPVFVNGQRFGLNGRVIHNLIVGEDVRLPFAPSFDAMSKASFLLGGYLDPVFAHESAHALMQDLYGVDAFRELEEQHMVSTQGHFEGAVTDPATALVEGFAEAFESYLAEKYIRPDVLARVPTIDRFIGNARDRLDLWTRGGARNIASYLFGIPGTMWQSLRLFYQVDDFMTDWLKMHRSAPLRDGTYLLKGDFAAIARRFGIVITDMRSPVPDFVAEELAEGATVTTQQAYSKEGVVAFVIYHLLKLGKAQELFAVMAEQRPKNIRDLIVPLLARLDARSRQQLQGVLSVTFDPRTRQAWGQELLKIDNEPSLPARASSAQSRLTRDWVNKLPESQRVPTGLSESPNDLWIEFETSPMVAWWQEVFGHERVLTRVNFATAGYEGVAGLIETLSLSAQASGRLIAAIQRAQRTAALATWGEFLESVRSQTIRLTGGPQLIQKLRASRSCFEHRCLSREE